MSMEIAAQSVSPKVPTQVDTQVRLSPVSEAASRTEAAPLRQNSALQQPQPANPRQQSADVASTVSELNSRAQQVQRKLEFRVDEDSGRTIVTVRDKESGEIIRQIPPEEMIEIGQRLKELAEELLPNTDVSGLLVKKQA
jgi:flagellar protein FlaG